MNNYNLTSIQENNEKCYLQTSFYRLPVHTSKYFIEQALEDNLHENIHDILKSGKVELFWVNEKQNVEILARLLAKNPDASFLPDGLKEQVLNASIRKQPYNFFIERGVSQNHIGSWEMKLRLSCEVEPNKRGFKHGFNLSVVAGTSLFLVSVDGNLKIVSVSEKEECFLSNDAFNKDCQTRRSISIALGLADY